MRETFTGKVTNKALHASVYVDNSPHLVTNIDFHNPEITECQVISILPPLGYLSEFDKIEETSPF